ncbi:MAG: hypothetical protein ACTHOR_07645 [Devosia sp.]|jgi:hypothetical protein|nr:hypothetical protein [Devosiaceae bacterium]
MRLLPTAALLIVALAGPAVAQSTQGRWECHGPAPTDPSQPAPHGLLAIFGQSYTYASATPDDPVSGGGGVEQQESGIAFTDGPLAEQGGVEIGQINTGAGTVAMDLSGQNGVLFTCLAM